MSEILVGVPDMVSQPLDFFKSMSKDVSLGPGFSYYAGCVLKGRGCRWKVEVT